MDPKVRRVNRAHRALQDQLEKMGIKVPRVCRVFQAMKVPKALKVLMGLKVSRGFKALKVSKALRVTQVPRVIKASKAPLELTPPFLARKVLKAPLDHKALKVFKAQKAQKVQQVLASNLKEVSPLSARHHLMVLTLVMFTSIQMVTAGLGMDQIGPMLVKSKVLKAQLV